jgi:uncharacterized OsmC-like protein
MTAVTKDGLMMVVGAAKEDSDALKMTYTATSRLESGFVNQTTMPGEHSLVVDEPPTMPGGQDKGPNPLDLFCGSLGTCQEITYKMYATIMEIPLDYVSCKVSGDIDLRGLCSITDDVGFSEIRCDVTVGSSATDEQLAQLKAAVDAHCPLVATLQNPVPVETQIAVASLNATATGEDPVTAEGLGMVVAAGKEDAKALSFTYASESKLAGAGFDTALTLSGHELTVDEPPAMPGGNNKGPNPLDLICASTGTCQTITYKMYATLMGIPMKAIEAEVQAKCDLRGLCGLADDAVAISSMQCKLKIDTTASEEQIQSLKAAVDPHCPMLELFTGKKNLKLTFKRA